MTILESLCDLQPVCWCPMNTGVGRPNGCRLLMSASVNARSPLGWTSNEKQCTQKYKAHTLLLALVALRMHSTNASLLSSICDFWTPSRVLETMQASSLATPPELDLGTPRNDTLTLVGPTVTLSPSSCESSKI
uniref:Uncharacterized protein n=1 Tax=viral metagenome TaxID=1070528 RepID=A0A6C0C008_9ZZZZ